MAQLTPGTDRLLVSVQATSLAAGAALESVSGATNTVGTGTVRMTPNSVNTTSPLTNTVWDGTRMEIKPGVLAPGKTAPDLKVFVIVDNVSYQSVFYIDASATGNALPPREQTVAQKAVLIGKSMLADAAAVSAGQTKTIKNAALLFTGFKVTDSLNVAFYSAAGYDAATFTSPPTVEIYGDVYDAAALAYVARKLNFEAGITMQSVRRALAGKTPYTNSFAWPNLGNQNPNLPNFNLANFKQLPNGAGQGAVKVWRWMKTAYNGAAVSANNFVLSNIQSLGGAAANLVNSYDDMGFAFTSTSFGILLREFGRRPGANAGYAGLFFGGSTYSPDDTAYGMVSTYGAPRIPFGSVQPLRSSSSEYFAPPAWGFQSPASQAPEVLANETAAMAISPQSGTTIALKTDETLLGGVRVGPQ